MTGKENVIEVNDKIEEIRKMVMGEAKEEDWTFHISLVVKHAKHLAKTEGADMEVVELSALLHDLGRLKFGGKDHELTGEKEAGKVLNGLGYPKPLIEKVKHCVKVHRADKDYKAETKEALIIRDADAIAHFDAIPLLIKVGLEKGKGDLKEAVRWVHEKIERDYNNKMHFPESKRLVEDKYRAAKLLLESTEKCYADNDGGNRGFAHCAVPRYFQS
jgi:uncharacterized protein